MNKSAYYKAETKLGQKKEEYFKQGNIAKWEISPEDLKKYDKNELLRNKDLAFRLMMQKVKNSKLNLLIGNSTCIHAQRKLRILFIPTAN